MDDFPHLRRWREAIQARSAAGSFAVRVEETPQVNMLNRAVRAVLFSQRVRT